LRYGRLASEVDDYLLAAVKQMDMWRRVVMRSNPHREAIDSKNYRHNQYNLTVRFVQNLMSPRAQFLDRRVRDVLEEEDLDLGFWI